MAADGSPLAQATRAAWARWFTQLAGYSGVKPGMVPPRVWIVWRTPMFGTVKGIELVTASEDRALRLAASSTWLRAEAVAVEDAGGCPGWCPNRDLP